MELRRFASFLAVAALAVPATSQDKAAATQASAQTAATPAAKKLEALKARFDKENQAAYDTYVKAKTDEEKQKAIAGMPGKNYLPEIRAIAEEAAGTDTAAQAWIWVLKLGVEPKERQEIVELLLSDHMSSTAMEELANQVAGSVVDQGEERVVEALRAIVDESPHPSARAAALFSLGTVLLDSKDAAHKAEGHACLEAVVTKYAEFSRGDSTYKAAAEGLLFALDHLQIGMTAPDFESVDENGVKWKLSDYKGKVVVVDFWGFW